MASPPQPPLRIKAVRHYEDDAYEYRNIRLAPRSKAQALLPRTLMTEDEWRQIGIEQRPGWEHYAIHAPEPHILLFRRLRKPERD